MNTKYILAYVASLALVSACGQQADDNVADTAAAPDTDGMVLPATTSSDAAREQYRAGWADFANARFNSAYDKFREAAETDQARFRTLSPTHISASVPMNRSLFLSGNYDTSQGKTREDHSLSNQYNKLSGDLIALLMRNPW